MSELTPAQERTKRRFERAVERTLRPFTCLRGMVIGDDIYLEMQARLLRIVRHAQKIGWIKVAIGRGPVWVYAETTLDVPHD